MTARPGPRPADLIRRAHARLDALYRAAEPPLTMPQFVLLEGLKRHGPIAARQLLERVGMDRSTGNHLLKRLREDGLIEAGPRTGFQVGGIPSLLTISATGNAARFKAEADLWRAEKRLLARLTMQERAQFLNCLTTAAFGEKP